LKNKNIDLHQLMVGRNHICCRHNKKKNMLLKNILLKIIILSTVLLIFDSCNQKSKETKQRVDQYLGKSIHLPKDSEVLFKDSLYHNFKLMKDTSALKITTLLWGDCHSCIKDLEKWEELYQIAKNEKNLKIYFYLFASDIKTFRKNLYTKKIYKYPLILDTGYVYMDRNDLAMEHKNFQTFLLDEKNKVVLIGNPTSNKKLRELYMNEINKRLGMQ